MSLTPEQREKFLVLLERVEGFSFGHPDYQDAVYALEAWIEQAVADALEEMREREAALLENLEDLEKDWRADFKGDEGSSADLASCGCADELRAILDEWRGKGTK